MSSSSQAKDNIPGLKFTKDVRWRRQKKQREDDNDNDLMWRKLKKWSMRKEMVFLEFISDEVVRKIPAPGVQLNHLLYLLDL